MPCPSARAVIAACTWNDCAAQMVPESCSVTAASGASARAWSAAFMLPDNADDTVIASTGLAAWR